MTPQQLRNSILQLAMEGKLVEQRPEEGTGEELYQLIEEQKKDLIKAGKLKRQKAIPEITEDEIPFEIPETWKWVRLSECLDVRDGTHDTPQYVEKGIPLVTSKNLVNGKIDFSTCKKISLEDHLKFSARSKVDINDILFAMIGSIGNPVLVSDENRFSIKNMALFKNTYKNIDMNYLYWFLYYSQRTMKIKASGGVQSFVSLTFLREFLFPLPPIMEQKRIVQKIEDIFPIIDRYENAWHKLNELNKKFPEELQKSILQEAIQGKLTNQQDDDGTAKELIESINMSQSLLVEVGKAKKHKKLPEIAKEEIPFDIPETWEWVRLGDIGETNIGLTYKPTDISDNGTIVLRSSNIQNGMLDYRDIVKVNREIPLSKMCQVGDIVICARNGSKRLVGKAALVDLEGMSFGAFMAIYRSLCNPYILRFINSIQFRNSLLPETGTTTINQITQDSLRKCLLPLPPLNEQLRIVNKIDTIMVVINRSRKIFSQFK